MNDEGVNTVPWVTEVNASVPFGRASHSPRPFFQSGLLEWIEASRPDLPVWLVRSALATS